MQSSKILSLDDALRTRSELQALGKVVVSLSGSFDIIHPGHIALLTEARAQGDVLFVLLNSDESIRGYKTGGRPFMLQDARAAVLLALKAVDFVTIFDDLTPLKVLEQLRPDVYVNGADWGKDCIERPLIESYGGKLHIVEQQGGLHSSDLVAKIQAAGTLKGS